VDRLSAGNLTETAQDESAATYAHKLQKSDGVIDWSASASTIHNQIRGLHPSPHAFSYLEGSRYVLLESRVDRDAAEGATGTTKAAPEDSDGMPHRPGTIVLAHGDELKVQTGDGVLKILRLQMEGRRPLHAREFLAGHRLAPGAAFTRPVP
jgi:methionyl-tRNA formyltransferase